MKCIKKLVALTLAAVLALAMLTACGGDAAMGALDFVKGEELTKALNEARVANKSSELNFDKEGTEGLKEYANAFLDWQLALQTYNANQTDANKSNVKTAFQAYQKAGKELSLKIHNISQIQICVEKEGAAFTYEAMKNRGENLFAYVDNNGVKCPLIDVDADTCLAAVVSKNGQTWAVIVVGTKG